MLVPFEEALVKLVSWRQRQVHLASKCGSTRRLCVHWPHSDWIPGNLFDNKWADFSAVRLAEAPLRRLGVDGGAALVTASSWTTPASAYLSPTCSFNRQHGQHGPRHTGPEGEPLWYVTVEHGLSSVYLSRLDNMTCSPWPWHWVCCPPWWRMSHQTALEKLLKIKTM